MSVGSPSRDSISCRVGSARGFGFERRLAHGLELDRPFDELARPRGHATEQDRDSRMSGELRHLRRGHRTDAVAAVDEHEPLGAGDAVPAQAQRDLLRELRDRSGVGGGRRRAENERARAGDVSARVRVRAAHVADDEVVVRQMLRRASRRRRRAETSECCNDIDLHRDRRSLDEPLEPRGNRGERFERDAEHVARAQHPRNVGDVGEPVLGSAEPRTLRERRVELAELGVEARGRAVLAAAQRVVRLREVVVPEDPESRERAVGGVGREERRLRDSALRGTP